MLCASTSYASEPDWDRGRGWNKSALKMYTYQCVHVTLGEYYNAYMVQERLNYCFEEVLAGRWNKHSKKKYIKERRRKR